MTKADFSLEIFPPKATDGIESVYKPLEGLSKLRPEFISVTFSAGGKGGRGLTGEVCEFVKKTYGIESVAHLTCTNSTKEFVSRYLTDLKKNGIKYVLALRGDINENTSLIDYRYASDLMDDIREAGGIGILAACYPEGHKESPAFSYDIEVMKLKEDKGAEHFVSQLFFDNSDFFRMRDTARAAGIKSKISAGIMPVTNAKQIVRMVQLSGAKIPEKLARLIARYENDVDGMYRAGLDYAVEQSIELIEGGTEAIHLYAMNNAETATVFYDGIKGALGR